VYPLPPPPTQRGREGHKKYYCDIMKVLFTISLYTTYSDPKILMKFEFQRKKLYRGELVGKNGNSRNSRFVPS
jgi:hypothetical protein